MATALPDFDRSAEFVALRPLRIDGLSVAKGARIDKSQLSTRKLRQLSEAHFIAQDGSAGSVVAVTYVANKRIKISGHWYEPGQEIDQDALDARRLRLMTEHNQLREVHTDAPETGTARALIERAKALKFFAFKREAERVLGILPAKTKKEDILAALEAHHGQPS